MNKFKIAERLAGKLGITRSEAARFLKGMTNLIYNVLRSGDTVKIYGFGQFKVSHRAPRIGVNPNNPLQKIIIPELSTPKFRAGKDFKKAIRLPIK
jgi:DNA-binding protein HU-alpha